MFDKQKLVNGIIDFFNSIVVSPLLLGFLILIVIDYLNIKKIKKWNELPMYEKGYIIIGWIMTFVIFFGILVSNLFYLKFL